MRFEGEEGVDIGGLTQEAFLAFWAEAYERHFDNFSLLAPSMHGSMDTSSLPALDLIISSGYLICGILPVRIAFPTLLAVLLPRFTDIPADILLEMFKNSVSCRFTNAQSSDDSEMQFRVPSGTEVSSH